MRGSELGEKTKKCSISLDEGRPRCMIIRADETQLGDYGNPDDNLKARRPHDDDYEVKMTT